MMRKLISVTALAPLFATLLAACGSDDLPDYDDSSSSSSGSTGPERECSSSFDCDNGTVCLQWRCEIGKCVADYAPAGVLVTPDNFTPLCKREVCDGMGNVVMEVDPLHVEEDDDHNCRMNACNPEGEQEQVTDPFDLPYEDLGDCKRDSCDVDGNPTKVPDPSDLPTEYPNNCKRSSCDPNGNAMYIPDPSDVPSQTAGDCRQSGCDANSGEIVDTPDQSDIPMDTTPGDCRVASCTADGFTTTVNGQDPPEPSTCATYTCQDGMAVVSMPMNVGTVCSDLGFTCSSAGQCSVCPGTDAQCTEIGPGVGAHTKNMAYNFGPVGRCDGSGSRFCGRIDSDQTAYFRYRGVDSGFLCSFDPYVTVSASGLVTLCEYFDCPSVSCPLGTTSSTLENLPGCCSAGFAPSMAITPSCAYSDVFFTIEPVGFSCLSYTADFHN